MPYRDLEPISKQLTIVVGLTVVGFMAFGLALSFYRNVLFQETLRGIEQQNRDLQEGIRDSQAELEYYRSAQYKDKYAKESLGRLNPGEKVLIITQITPAPGVMTEDTELTESEEAALEEQLRQIPVIEHWRLYLFERERIDDWKRSLLL